MTSNEFNIDQQEDDDLRCPICNFYFSQITKPYLLPCNHNLCNACINGIIKKNMLDCPICRKNFTLEERKNFKVNFAFLNLVIKILKSKVIYCTHCEKVFNWIDHHTICDQKNFKETSEIMGEIKKLAEDCCYVIQEEQKHKTILKNSKDSIYKHANDIVKLINLKFYENFSKTILYL